MLIERGKDGKEKQSHGLYSPRGRKESDLAELLSRHFTFLSPRKTAEGSAESGKGLEVKGLSMGSAFQNPPPHPALSPLHLPSPQALDPRPQNLGPHQTPVCTHTHNPVCAHTHTQSPCAHNPRVHTHNPVCTHTLPMCTHTHSVHTHTIPLCTHTHTPHVHTHNPHVHTHKIPVCTHNLRVHTISCTHTIPVCAHSACAHT